MKLLATSVTVLLLRHGWPFFQNVTSALPALPHSCAAVHCRVIVSLTSCWKTTGVARRCIWIYSENKCAQGTRCTQRAQCMQQAHNLFLTKLLKFPEKYSATPRKHFFDRIFEIPPPQKKIWFYKFMATAPIKMLTNFRYSQAILLHIFFRATAWEVRSLRWL